MVSSKSGDSMARRDGFSRWDLAVGVLVVAALAGICLPMLSRDEETARKDVCLANLHAIGVALQAYHDAYGRLPPAACGNSTFDHDELPLHAVPHNPNRPADLNWALLLLPYLGEEDLYSQFDFKVQVTHERNAKPRMTRVARMNCPSDVFNTSENYFRRQLAKYPSVSFARGNYGLNQGTKYTVTCFTQEGGQGDFPGNLAEPAINGLVKHTWQNYSEVVGDGVSDFNRSNRFRDFPNGLAKMVSVDELRAGLTSADSRGAWAFGYIGGNITAGHGLWGDDGGPNCLNPRADDVIGCPALHSFYTEGQLRTLRMPCCSYIGAPNQATSRSMHPGGVQVLTLDGSAHFIADEVDLNLWHALHSREPAELTGSLSARDLSLVSSIPAVVATSRPPILPSDAASSITNSIGMNFTLVPKGEFIMGLPDKGAEAIPNLVPTDSFPQFPQHNVRITHTFYLGTYEVTQQNFRDVMGENPSWNQNRFDRDVVDGKTDTSQFPVEQVSWYKAIEFCSRLTQLPQEKEAGRRYRLPTEAEWEYACRGGDTEPPQHPKNGSEGGEAAVRPVGSFRPNGFGLYDMRENIWEWCADWFDGKYYARSPVDDPPGPTSGALKVVRGRDWIFGAHYGCGLVRDPSPPIRTHRLLGFRVICEFTVR